MSDSLQIFVHLDPLSRTSADGLGINVLGWLTELEIARPAHQTEEHGAAERIWEAGPRWCDAVLAETIRVDPERYAREITVSSDRLVQSAMENSEDPRCQRCSAALDSGVMSGSDVLDSQGRPVPNRRPGPFTYDYGELIDAWLVSDEPEVRCVQCGWTARLGDWVTDYFPGLVGAPGVVFRDWPALNPDFIRALVARLGGRSRYISAYL